MKLEISCDVVPSPLRGGSGKGERRLVRYLKVMKITAAILAAASFIELKRHLFRNAPLPNPPRKGEGIRMRLRYIAVLSFILTSPAYADITIAAVGPLTGQDAPTGEQMQRGAEAAVDAINQSGGVLGQKLHLILKDDACDPKQAVAVANELSGENVFGVIGHMCSGSAIPASKTYNEEGILMISPSATSPALTDQGFDNIFRTCGRDEQQGAIIADFIAKHYPGKSVALVHDKTAYGQGLADEVHKNLARLGLKEKMYESISRGERDYSSLVSKLKQNNIDVLFFRRLSHRSGIDCAADARSGIKNRFYRRR